MRAVARVAADLVLAVPPVAAAVPDHAAAVRVHVHAAVILPELPVRKRERDCRRHKNKQGRE